LGKVMKISMFDFSVSFMPVAYAVLNESKPEGSIRLTFLHGLFKYRNSIKDLDADIFYIHSIEAFLPISFLYRRSKKIMFSHGNYFEIVPFLRFAAFKIYNRFMVNQYIKLSIRKANMIFVLDNKTQNQYGEYTDSKKIKLVGNSIDCSMFDKAGINSGRGTVNILFVGRLSKNKGLENIIKAVKELNEDKVILNIAGCGEEYEFLKALIIKSNVQHKVNLLGRVIGKSLVELYQNSDMLIMNSVTEGTPMVILEAFSAGIPVIATPAGNIPKLINEGYNGEFTDGSVDTIVYKIKKIIASLDEYKENSLASSEKYSYKNVNKRIYNLLLKKEF
jgi:glycosyltransferase involved in cell wall biosynthesis